MLAGRGQPHHPVRPPGRAAPSGCWDFEAGLDYRTRRPERCRPTSTPWSSATRSHSPASCRRSACPCGATWTGATAAASSWTRPGRPCRRCASRQRQPLRNRIRHLDPVLRRLRRGGELPREREPRTTDDVQPLLTPRPSWATSGVDLDARRRASLISARRAATWPRPTWTTRTNEATTTPGFFDLDATLSLDLGRWIKVGPPRLRVQVTNVLDNARIFPSGYSYLYFTRGATGPETLAGTPYYYPLATRACSCSWTSRCSRWARIPTRSPECRSSASWPSTSRCGRTSGAGRSASSTWGPSSCVFWQAQAVRGHGPSGRVRRPCARTGGTSGFTAGPDRGALPSRGPRTSRSGPLASSARREPAPSSGPRRSRRLTDASLPFWDSSTTSFSLVAQFMQTRKWIENWTVWIVVDVVYVGMYVYKSLCTDGRALRGVPRPRRPRTGEWRKSLAAR